MAARNSVAARNGNTPKFGLPTGKFLELSQKTNRPGPYPITDQLVVPPPTKKRREQMRDAEQRMVIGQAQLNIAYSLANVPSPPMPGQTAVAKVEDADEQAGLDAAAGAEYKQDMAQWKREVAQWRDNLFNAQQQIGEYTKQIKQADVDYDRAFLGDDYEKIVEFFDEQDESLWDEFRRDLAKHWVPSQPDDDVEDEEEAGKALKSSTG